MSFEIYPYLCTRYFLLTENRKTEHIAGTLHYDVKAARGGAEVSKPIEQMMRETSVPFYFRRTRATPICRIYYPIHTSRIRVDCD